MFTSLNANVCESENETQAWPCCTVPTEKLLSPSCTYFQGRFLQPAPAVDGQTDTLEHLLAEDWGKNHLLHKTLQAEIVEESAIVEESPATVCSLPT